MCAKRTQTLIACTKMSGFTIIASVQCMGVTVRVGDGGEGGPRPTGVPKGVALEYALSGFRVY